MPKEQNKRRMETVLIVGRFRSVDMRQRRIRPMIAICDMICGMRRCSPITTPKR
jgi:hypothetical protein